MTPKERKTAIKEKKALAELLDIMLNLLDDIDVMLDEIEEPHSPKIKQGLPKVLMPRDYYC